MPGPQSAPNGDKSLTTAPYDKRTGKTTGKTAKRRSKGK